MSLPGRWVYEKAGPAEEAIRNAGAGRKGAVSEDPDITWPGSGILQKRLQTDTPRSELAYKPSLCLGPP